MSFNRALLPAFLLYAMCGGVATAFDWGSFYLTSFILKWHYLPAVIVSFSLGAIINYIANKFITFKNYYRNIPLQFSVYLFGVATALALTALQMFLLVGYFHIPKMVARITVTGIMLFFNFAYNNWLTFGRLK
ncbi:MAG: GtrA family protein [Thermodesulfobacteriota bacterium]